jgi:pyruvate/2-oxoglutarate dehydrogenase complex dihydrolipoamide acyltransferase (E2) component
MSEPAQLSYQIVEFPPDRRDMPVINALNARKHFMYGLLEVDVTCARQFLAASKARTGETPSFTGFLAWCLARAVDEDKTVQAYRKGHKQLVLFDDVDVGLMIERQLGDKRVLMGHVLRRANHKSYWEIHQEIRAVQAAPVPQLGGMPPWLRAALVLPWPLAVGVQALVRTAFNRDPARFAAMVGTVGITAVGMFGKGVGGWGITPIIHELGLIVGSTATKPAVVAGRIEPREILNLTVVFDHDIVDGAPAARFTRRLVELIECGGELAAEGTSPPTAVAPAASRMV